MIVDIVSFNDDVDTLNSWREKINDSIDKYIFELKRKELEPHISSSVEMFIKNSDLLSNFLKLLKNKIINLMAENRLLLDWHKSRKKRIEFLIKRFFKKTTRDNEIKKYRESLEKEIEENYKNNKEMLKEAGVLNNGVIIALKQK